MFIHLPLFSSLLVGVLFKLFKTLFKTLFFLPTFEAIIVSLLDTVVTLEVPGIVNEAVDEETLEYLLDRRAERAFEALVIEPIQDICLEDGGPIEVAIEEMDEELAVEGILHAAADELAEEVGQKVDFVFTASCHAMPLHYALSPICDSCQSTPLPLPLPLPLIFIFCPFF